ncbi:unnamed protein product [Rotaria magnacalcarata]|uniref:Uncharacterized protein n=1 Tax=Rotaria magnacalcarata TaxID=392030 RepID=A0A819ZBK8_9BILA|nr:unnamed protein product [Rotaria magnacalcarata]
MTLGLHHHNVKGHEHHRGYEVLYVFYLFERVLHGISRYRHNQNSAHSHDHNHIIRLTDTTKADQTNSNTTLNIDKNLAHDHVHHQNMRQASEEKSNTSNKKFEHKNSSKVTGWMIILEDGIHNFADGLAIETIFSERLMC